MRLTDTLNFAVGALRGHQLRTFLVLLAMAIGVASVVVLTSLGDGARRYVTNQFSALGTNLLIVLPGRAETTGSAPPLTGETPRDLTIEDSQALLRSFTIKAVAPIVVGSAPVAWQERNREVTILGTTASFFSIRKLKMARGRFLPQGEIFRGSAVCVLGRTLAHELFGKGDPVGHWVRIGGSRFLVIGVLESFGISLGFDMDDLALIPAASAQTLFNTFSLFRIMVEARERDDLDRAKADVLRIIKQRHENEEDITVITQDAVLATFDRIFTALTLTVGGIGAISLLVAGVLVMNVMLVAVSQRTSEIGLLKALGASRRRILVLFLTESAFLSLIGAVVGIGIGLASNSGLRRLFPDFPITTPPWALAAALGTALFTGVLFGMLPARRASLLDPVDSLARR
ncbi:MAG: ABC transporter permease [Deltaproteobacteria bacterium]